MLRRINNVLPKELVIAAMSGKSIPSPFRPPAVLFSGGAWTCKQAGYQIHQLVGYPQELAEIIIKVNDHIESDMVFPGSGFNNFLLEALGGKIKLFGDTVPMLDGPVFHEEYSCDRPIARCLEQNTGVQTVLKAVALVQKKIGHRFLVATTGWGPFTTAALLLGVEKFMRKLKHDPKFAHDLLEYATEVVGCYYDKLRVEAFLPVASIAEPIISGTVISTDNFQTFALPYLKKLMKRLKQHNYKIILHVCGDTSDRLNLLNKLKLDCLSLDQQVNLSKVREAVGEKLCIAGNLDPVSLLERGEPKEVRQKAEFLLNQFSQDKRFVLMAGCDLPPSVKIENVLACLQTAKNFRPQTN